MTRRFGTAKRIRTWAKQLPFWSESKIKRLFIKPENLGLVQSTDKFNTFYVDRTKWYSIEYSVLDALFHTHTNAKQPTTVHRQTLPPSTDERSEGAQGVHSKLKDFKTFKKREMKKKRKRTPPSLNKTYSQTPKQDAPTNKTLATQIDHIIQYLNTKTGKVLT